VVFSGDRLKTHGLIIKRRKKDVYIKNNDGKKKRRTLLIAIISLIVLAAGGLGAYLVMRTPYRYEVIVTDTSGNEISDLSQLKKGDVIYLKATVDKKKKNKTDVVYGLEMTFTTKGLTYNGDARSFCEDIEIGSQKQAVAKTRTLSFLYYDFDRIGISVEFPQVLARCSYTVDDPEIAEIVVSTGLLYTVDHTDGYQIKNESR